MNKIYVRLLSFTVELCLVLSVNSLCFTAVETDNFEHFHIRFFLYLSIGKMIVNYLSRYVFKTLL